MAQLLRSLAPDISILSATMPIMWLDKMVVTDTYSSYVTPRKCRSPCTTKDYKYAITTSSIWEKNLLQDIQLCRFNMREDHVK